VLLAMLLLLLLLRRLLLHRLRRSLTQAPAQHGRVTLQPPSESVTQCAGG
jgi:hypothetical protein